MSKYFLLHSALIFILIGCSNGYNTIEHSTLINTHPEIKGDLDQAIMKIGDQRGYEKIDFENYTYIVIASGQKNGSGYGIKINSLKKTDKEIVITLEELLPRSEATLAVLVNPNLILQIGKTKKIINLKWDK